MKIRLTVANLTFEFDDEMDIDKGIEPSLIMQVGQQRINIDTDAIPYIRDFLKTINDQVW